MNTISEYITAFGLNDIFEETIRRHMTLRTVIRGEMLVRIGEPLKEFFLLVEGKLKVYTLLENGKKILLRFYRPLSLVGDLEYLNDRPPRAIVEAQESSVVIAISMEDIRNHTFDSPRFLRFVISQLSQKLYSHSILSALNLVYPLENRVASYLWSVARIDDQKRLEEIRVNSLAELADMLSTSYRHLCRVLNRLQADGLISRYRGNIRILDFDQLEEMAVELFE